MLKNVRHVVSARGHAAWIYRFTKLLIVRSASAVGTVRKPARIRRLKPRFQKAVRQIKKQIGLYSAQFLLLRNFFWKFTQTIPINAPHPLAIPFGLWYYITADMERLSAKHTSCHRFVGVLTGMIGRAESVMEEMNRKRGIYHGRSIYETTVGGGRSLWSSDQKMEP